MCGIILFRPSLVLEKNVLHNDNNNNDYSNKTTICKAQ